MTNKVNGLNTFNTLLPQVKLELLETLLEPEDAAYPWNPANHESEAYFSELEQRFATQDFFDEELLTQSQAFYSHLDSLWSEVTTCTHHKCDPNQSVLDSLQVALNSTFANVVPQTWLNAIAQKAADIFSSQQTMSDQLVQCVQSVLPAWDVEDLFVLTRPFAHAMRSSESPDVKAMLSKTENRDWLNLSEVEQAKISVAIAYYAFQQLNGVDSED
ncbi:hypothetical protein [Nodularia sp. UHCC 0506]|uniref:hypothetical protein n=1 Tax=Nodularia sp. UHCC 0506 TaxID=3110243 RepID=UPI002B1FDDB6|nr:hypothetical protein [Nodularia sp. UHCC 0506]MEA5512876.1 hypothetical protein [Nodularia sp. UHCC 0506]